MKYFSQNLEKLLTLQSSCEILRSGPIGPKQKGANKMLELNDIVSAKDKKGKVTFLDVFKKVYLQYGPSDETETKDSKIMTVDENGEEIEYKTADGKSPSRTTP